MRKLVVVWRSGRSLATLLDGERHKGGGIPKHHFPHQLIGSLAHAENVEQATCF